MYQLKTYKPRKLFFTLLLFSLAAIFIIQLVYSSNSAETEPSAQQFVETDEDLDRPNQVVVAGNDNIPQYYEPEYDPEPLIAVYQNSEPQITVVATLTPNSANANLPDGIANTLENKQNERLVLTVNVDEPQHEISPHIYGINLASEDAARVWQLPINRWGGNALSRYNWQIDVYNSGNYYYFTNQINPDPGNLPNDSTADRFVQQNIRTNTETLMQMPIMGWVPKSRELDCGFRWSRYGEQTDADWKAEWGFEDSCGNGITSEAGDVVIGNKPTDTSFAIDPTFIQDWVRHLMGRFNSAENGGVRYYALDNEPMIWHYNHRDVHPQLSGYDYVFDKGVAYGTAIKAVDSQAKVMGPGVWGWVSYFYSSLDTETADADPDRDQYEMDFIPWYLQQMAQFEADNGYRLLDYLDFHYYPQAYTEDGAIALSSAGGDKTQDLRLRSTKDLWDTEYVAESWIEEPTYVIPRMRDWVDQYYPGTELVLSEYRWGALDTVNGALAQADVLGVFGREDLAMAFLWDAPALGQPGDYAIRMYRNYDGLGNTFGDINLPAQSTDQDILAIYAAQDSDSGNITVMVINKTKDNLSNEVVFNGFGDGVASIYRYSGATPSQIVKLPNLTVENGKTFALFPAESITLFVLGENSAETKPSRYVIHDDQLDANWLDLSWSTVDFTDNRQIQSGSSSISVKFEEAYAGFYLYANSGIPYDKKDSLRFWLHGGEFGDTPLDVHLVNGDLEWSSPIRLVTKAGQWQVHELSLAGFDMADVPLITGIIFRNPTADIQPTFFVDEIVILNVP